MPKPKKRPMKHTLAELKTLCIELFSIVHDRTHAHPFCALVSPLLNDHVSPKEKTQHAMRILETHPEARKSIHFSPPHVRISENGEFAFFHMSDGSCPCLTHPRLGVFHTEEGQKIIDHYIQKQAMDKGELVPVLINHFVHEASALQEIPEHLMKPLQKNILRLDRAGLNTLLSMTIDYGEGATSLIGHIIEFPRIFAQFLSWIGDEEDHYSLIKESIEHIFKEPLWEHLLRRGNGSGLAIIVASMTVEQVFAIMHQRTEEANAFWKSLNAYPKALRILLNRAGQEKAMQETDTAASAASAAFSEKEHVSLHLSEDRLVQVTRFVNDAALHAILDFYTEKTDRHDLIKRCAMLYVAQHPRNALFFKMIADFEADDLLDLIEIFSSTEAEKEARVQVFTFLKKEWSSTKNSLIFVPRTEILCHLYQKFLEKGGEKVRLTSPWLSQKARPLMPEGLLAALWTVCDEEEKTILLGSPDETLLQTLFLSAFWADLEFLLRTLSPPLARTHMHALMSHLEDTGKAPFIPHLLLKWLQRRPAHFDWENWHWDSVPSSILYDMLQETSAPCLVSELMKHGREEALLHIIRTLSPHDRRRLWPDEKHTKSPFLEGLFQATHIELLKKIWAACVDDLPAYAGLTPCHISGEFPIPFISYLMAFSDLTLKREKEKGLPKKDTHSRILMAQEIIKDIFNHCVKKGGDLFTLITTGTLTPLYAMLQGHQPSNDTCWSLLSAEQALALSQTCCDEGILSLKIALDAKNWSALKQVAHRLKADDPCESLLEERYKSFWHIHTDEGAELMKAFCLHKKGYFLSFYLHYSSPFWIEDLLQTPLEHTHQTLRDFLQKEDFGKIFLQGLEAKKSDDQSFAGFLYRLETMPDEEISYRAAVLDEHGLTPVFLPSTVFEESETEVLESASSCANPMT